MSKIRQTSANHGAHGLNSRNSTKENTTFIYDFSRSSIVRSERHENFPLIKNLSDPSYCGQNNTGENSFNKWDQLLL